MRTLNVGRDDAGLIPGCAASDDTIGAKVEVDGICWEHVHQDAFSVVDASHFSAVYNPDRYPRGSNPVHQAATRAGNLNTTYLSLSNYLVLRVTSIMTNDRLMTDDQPRGGDTRRSYSRGVLTT